MKLQGKLYAIANTAIRVILVLIVSGLLLQSMFSTSFIGLVMTEDGILLDQTRNIADHPWRHLVLFAGFTILGALACRVCRKWGARKEDDARSAGGSYNRRIFRILSIFVLGMGTLWIMVTQLQPGSDPAKVYGIAMQWREGNFSSYAEGGYLFRYPFQAGIILFYYFLSFVFGVDNYIGLQFVNVIALAAVYVLLSKMAALFWKKEEKLPVLVYAALVLWLPLAFYVTYLYGILPGMALSLGAVYCVMKYLDSRKYRYILPACICMGLATVIKMNCLIYLIAAACFLIYDAVESLFGRSGNMAGDSSIGSGRKKASGRALVSLMVILLMGLSVKGCNGAVNRYVERLSGYQAGNGFEMLSWVVMGLQETPLGPGGYSGYIGDVYVEHNYDADKVREASWAEIKKIVTRMSENPLDDGVTFFARKNAFQWNDPSFISLDRTKGRNSAIEMPGFVSGLIEGKGSVIFYVAMNYAQTLLLFGMLLYLFLNWKSRNLYELMGAVIFLGGYLFHFLWESSASYTIPYFVVMIPYAVKGLADWVRYVDGLPGYMAENRRGTVGKKELLRKLGAPAGGTVAAVVFVILLAGTNLFYQTFALDDGEEARAQFYQEGESRNVPETMADGNYDLVPLAAQDMVLAEKDGEVTCVSLDVSEKILLHQESGRGTAGNSYDTGVSIRFRSNEQVLAAEQAEDGFRLTVYMDDGMNMFYVPQENVSWLWKLYGTPEQGYSIVLDDMAITYRGGAVALEKMDGSEEQRWMFR